MKELSNTKAELKKALLIKKGVQFLFEIVWSHFGFDFGFVMFFIWFHKNVLTYLYG